VEGSSNYRKAKLRVARYQEHTANQRKDFLHKMTTEVCKAFGVVCIEDLNLKGLCQTRLAKSFNDAGIGYAIQMLSYKANTLQKVDRFFPSSKLCNVCGLKNTALTLSDRVWLCACGVLHDRDHNASINIELEGVRLLVAGGYSDVTPVEFAASTSVTRLTQAMDCEAGTDRYAYHCISER
jgi:putative transposase